MKEIAVAHTHCPLKLFLSFAILRLSDAFATRFCARVMMGFEYTHCPLNRLSVSWLMVYVVGQMD
jgi:hypothetical protein